MFLINGSPGHGRIQYRLLKELDGRQPPWLWVSPPPPHEPELGCEPEMTLRTGTACIHEPHWRRPVTWHFDRG